MSSPSWSYSGIKKFETCPKQFYHIKVLKEYEEPPTEATLYGTQFHEAAEFYIKNGTSARVYRALTKSLLTTNNNAASTCSTRGKCLNIANAINSN